MFLKCLKEIYLEKCYNLAIWKIWALHNSKHAFFLNMVFKLLKS